MRKYWGRRIFFFLLAYFPSTVLKAEILIGPVTVSGENRLTLNNNSISGAGAASSFLTRNSNFEDQLSLFSEWKESADNRWVSQIQGRFTDDPRIDVKHMALQRFSLERLSPSRRLSLGDFYGSFSQYSLNQNIKGLRWEEENIRGVKLGVILGLAKNRWDDLWDNNTSETLNRHVLGVSAHRHFPLSSGLGTTLVVTKDDRTPSSTSDRFSQRLFSLQWQVPSNADLSLSGESAWSLNDVARVAGANASYSGWAHKVNARSRYSIWRTRNDFERVSPYFITTLGAASADFKRFQSRNQFRVKSDIDFILDFSWYRNNLKLQQQDTARTRSPEVGVRWMAPLSRSSLNLEARLRHRQTTHSSSSIAKNIDFSQILSASDRLGSLNVDFSYEHRLEERVGQQKNFRNVFGLGLSGFERWGDFLIRPYARWNIDHDDDKTLSVNNQTTEASAGVVVDLTSEFSASASYRRQKVANAQADSSLRNSLDCRLGYALPFVKGDRLEMGFRDNVSSFGVNSKNYRESVLETSYVHKF